MFSTLALAAALGLAPAQKPALTVSNVRVTEGGEFGPARKDTRYLPGDMFRLAFDIENLTTDAKGIAHYLIGIDVTDAGKKSVYNVKPTELSEYLALGGTRLPANAYMRVVGLAPGSYSAKITITDKATKATREMEKTFEALPPAFGIVDVVLSGDERQDRHVASTFVAGQVLWLHFHAANFGRDTETKEPNVRTEIRVTDANGNSVNEKPQEFVTTRLAVGEISIPHPIRLPLNRDGKFTIQIKSECKVTGKSDTRNVPITVVPGAK